MFLHQATYFNENIFGLHLACILSKFCCKDLIFFIRKKALYWLRYYPAPIQCIVVYKPFSQLRRFSTASLLYKILRSDLPQISYCIRFDNSDTATVQIQKRINYQWFYNFHKSCDSSHWKTNMCEDYV